MSPNTERGFRRLLHQHALLEGPADALPDLGALRDLVEHARVGNRPAQQESSVDTWLATISSQFDKGAGPKAIFDWLKLHEPDFKGSLSAVKRCVHHLQKARGVREEDVVIRVETPPGLVAQVDFGDVGQIWCPELKKQRRAYVFVMVLGYSRHIFAKIVFDQTAPTWLALHAAAFAFFGGVPATIVPDNLKAAVLRAAFDVRSEATLNLSYRDLGRHYGFTIDPTPPYNPEKKGKVESSVKYIKNNFFVTLADRGDLARANAQLEEWNLKIAATRQHGTTHEAPLLRFERDEALALRVLPARAWEPTHWRRVQVRDDSHILLIGAIYSVPWRLIGKTVLVRMFAASIEIYWEDTRVATHERSPKGTTRTEDAHLPSQRRDYRQRDPAYWRERAAALHPEVAAYIAEVFASDAVQNQVTKVAAMMQLLESAGAERAPGICRRASYYGNFTYTGMKNIHRDRLDLQPLPLARIMDAQGQPTPRFARSLTQCLANYLESTELTEDASN